MFKQQQEREYHVDLFQLFLCKNPNRAGGAAWPLPRAKVMPKNTQPPPQKKEEKKEKEAQSAAHP